MSLKSVPKKCSHGQLWTEDCTPCGRYHQKPAPMKSTGIMLHTTEHIAEGHMPYDPNAPLTVDKDAFLGASNYVQPVDPAEQFEGVNMYWKGKFEAITEIVGHIPSLMKSPLKAVTGLKSKLYKLMAVESLLKDAATCTVCGAQWDKPLTEYQSSCPHHDNLKLVWEKIQKLHAAEYMAHHGKHVINVPAGIIHPDVTLDVKPVKPPLPLASHFIVGADCIIFGNTPTVKLKKAGIMAGDTVECIEGHFSGHYLVAAGEAQKLVQINNLKPMIETVGDVDKLVYVGVTPEQVSSENLHPESSLWAAWKVSTCDKPKGYHKLKDQNGLIDSNVTIEQVQKPLGKSPLHVALDLIDLGKIGKPFPLESSMLGQEIITDPHYTPPVFQISAGKAGHGSMQSTIVAQAVAHSPEATDLINKFVKENAGFAVNLTASVEKAAAGFEDLKLSLAKLNDLFKSGPDYASDGLLLISGKPVGKLSSLSLDYHGEGVKGDMQMLAKYSMGFQVANPKNIVHLGDTFDNVFGGPNDPVHLPKLSEKTVDLHGHENVFDALKMLGLHPSEVYKAKVFKVNTLWNSKKFGVHIEFTPKKGNGVNIWNNLHASVPIFGLKADDPYFKLIVPPFVYVVDIDRQGLAQVGYKNFPIAVHGEPMLVAGGNDSDDVWTVQWQYSSLISAPAPKGLLTPKVITKPAKPA